MQLLGPDFRNGMVKRVELCQRAKFRGDSSNRRQDMAMFRLFKMAAAAILDFSNFKFLTVGRLKRAELHRRAKFSRNRSNRVVVLIKCIFSISRVWLENAYSRPQNWGFNRTPDLTAEGSRACHSVTRRTPVPVIGVRPSDAFTGPGSAGRSGVLLYR